MSLVYNILSELDQKITKITPIELSTLVDKKESVAIIDVREPSETIGGMLPSAVSIPRGVLEFQIEEVASKEKPLVLLCSSGRRSLLAARSLIEMGYQHVSSLEGGMEAWKNAGLPWRPRQSLSPVERAQYARHVTLPEVGEKGQIRLRHAKVLIVGLGGLGSSAAYYLAAAGVGTIGLVDHDKVEVSNLQRQIIHDASSIGSYKTESAKRNLSAFNPNIRIETYREKMVGPKLNSYAKEYDLIIDATDNAATRNAINTISLAYGVPVIFASVFKYDGQITVFSGKKGGPCYRCLVPVLPPKTVKGDCNQTGVLGVLPGALGVLQATEALKLLCGIGRPLVGKILFYDAKKMSFHTIGLPAKEQCQSCGGSPVKQVAESTVNA